MKSLIKALISIFLTTTFANITNSYAPDIEMNVKFKINNAILAKVADKTITAYDVMKKLELNFNKAYPDLLNSPSARYQFYLSGWQATLEELINHQLILLDATSKELKITDSEIKEEVEIKYSPNHMVNLKNLNLSYDEVIKLTQEEMIVHRMLYYFVKAKADQKITPAAIRSAYHLYCIENPAKETWSYYIITTDCIADKETSEKVLSLIREINQDPQDMQNLLSEIEKKYQNCKISISQLYKADNKELSTSLQKILNNLKTNTYSDIITQTNKAKNKKVLRIFYLKDYEKKEIESFHEISNKLKEKLLQKALLEESEKYFAKLKKKYPVEKNENISKDFLPFIVEQ